MALVYISLLLISTFLRVDLGRQTFTAYSHPIYPLLIVGLLALAGVSVAANAPQFLQRSAIGAQININSTPDSLATDIGQNTLRVQFGRLETAATAPDSSLIVLPANEYFDDKCITDTKSALGSFVQSKLRGRTVEFEREVKRQLANRASQTVVIDGVSKRSYGLGTAVYLDHPLKETLNLLVVAATTQRPGEGLQGDVMTLFTIVRETMAVAKDRRLSDIFQPLIGAGHGAIKPSRALLAQMIAWSELMFAYPGQKVSVTIVLLPPDEKRRSSISLTQAQQLLRVAVSVCQPEDTK